LSSLPYIKDTLLGYSYGLTVAVTKTVVTPSGSELCASK